MSEIYLGEGFPGENMHVLPRPFLKTAENHPLIKPLMPTDIGWFPSAYHHYRARPEGTPEHILIFCVGGKGWFKMDGVRGELKPLEALLIPKHTPHVYGSDENDPWSIHWVHFIGEIGDYFVEQCDSSRIPVDDQTARRMGALFESCRDAFVANFVLHHMIYASQALHHLLGYLIFNNRAFSPVLGGHQFHSIDRTLTYLHQNVRARLTLDDMADYAGLSRSHFVRLFKEQTEYSPMDYFIRLKMQHACMLLSFTKKTIKEISFELGYDDPYYFSRAFKKAIGMAPMDYRNNS